MRNYKADNLESKIVSDIVKMLTLEGWFVVKTHGNMFQSGLPDLFATHVKYGARWIEVKRPTQFQFTPAQVITFPKLCANGSGVWVLMGATKDDYQKLFQKYNWWTFQI